LSVDVSDCGDTFGLSDHIQRSRGGSHQDCTSRDTPLARAIQQVDLSSHPGAAQILQHTLRPILRLAAQHLCAFAPVELTPVSTVERPEDYDRLVSIVAHAL
jgi:hypothetical protein